MDKEDIKAIGICIFVVISFCIFVFGISALSCEAKFSQYGVTEYGPIQGCMITNPDGKRLPAETIREI